jgi:anti-sigma regulatory factor (Ser/Thr protein kinase)
VAADQIFLTFPCEEGFEHVAQLVLGGVAARHNLTYESLDDLGTALGSLLERAESKEPITVALTLDPGTIRTEVGPFRGAAVSDELAHDSDSDVGLRRILETVVDSFRVGQREDGSWVELTKAVPPSPPES